MSTYRMTFGWQMERFRRSQLDSVNGTTISADRFYDGTGWTPEELRGQRILEVGCGAGRFTEIMVKAGAKVVSLDYSDVVRTCRKNTVGKPPQGILQGDLYHMPFQLRSFDKVFCFGVIQYTPDPELAFKSLLQFLKPGGKLAVDFYRVLPFPSRWASKYLWRWLTKRLPTSWVFGLVNWYVPKWLPIDNRLNEMRFVWRFAEYIRGIIPCWNYTGAKPLSQAELLDWAVLDTFNSLAPRYDNPLTMETVQSWFDEARLVDQTIRYGSNGILGCARTRESGAQMDRATAHLHPPTAA